MCLCCICGWFQILWCTDSKKKENQLLSYLDLTVILTATHDFKRVKKNTIFLFEAKNLPI